MHRLLFLGLWLFAQAVRAEPSFVAISISDESPQTLEQLVDEFTYDYLEQIFGHHETVVGETYRETPTGYEINGLLLAELSTLSPDRRDPLLAMLRRIYVKGEPWRGKTFKHNPGQLGVSIDPGRSIEDIITIVERFDGSMAHIAFESVCDFWLTKGH